MANLGTIIDRLQRAGFSISLSERIDSHKILTLSTNLEELMLGLRMLFAKNRQQQQLFDLLWKLGAIQPDQIDKKINPSTVEEPLDTGITDGLMGSKEWCATGIMPGGGGGQSQGMGSGIPGIDSFTALVKFSSEFKGAVRQLIQGNIRNAAANMLRHITKGSYSLDELMQRKIDAMEEIEDMVRTITPQYADILLKKMDKEYISLIKERIELLDQIKVKDPFSAVAIEDLPLISLTPSTELTLTLKKLGRKLAMKHKRMKKSGNRKINLRQTIRANIQHGGTILELRTEKRRKDKPKLMLLTDISSSTLHATRLFLNIIWHAKEVFSDIRFYQFIGSCIDVTTEYRTAKSIDEGIKNALKSWDDNVFEKENSDYNRALISFEKMNKNQLGSSTTVIILGDLRDWLGPWKNGQPNSAKVLGRIKRKAKKVFVLNPEEKMMWDTGDSICKYCIDEGVEVYETTNLDKLIKVILDIL